MSKYMGQIMAECDCRHSACKMRGYCMADRIEELEADRKKTYEAMLKVTRIHDEVEANLVKAVALLSRAIDMTGELQCYHDHHGYCQAHNLEPRGECWVELSQALIEELKGQDDE